MHYQIAQDKIRLKGLMQALPDRKDEFARQYEELQAYEAEEMALFAQVDLDDLLGWSDKGKDKEKDRDSLDREAGSGDRDEQDRQSLEESNKALQDEQGRKDREDHLLQHQEIDRVNLDQYRSADIDLDNMKEDDLEADRDMGEMPYGG